MADTAGPQLMAYLRDRLNEEETETRRAWPETWRPADRGPGVESAELGPLESYRMSGLRMQVAHMLGTVGKLQTEEANANHIATWDPARVLAEIEAKRAILDEIERIVPVCLDPMTGGGIVALALAQVYVDRDDFQPEWRTDRG